MLGAANTSFCLFPSVLHAASSCWSRNLKLGHRQARTRTAINSASAYTAACLLLDIFLAAARGKSFSAQQALTDQMRTTPSFTALPDDVLQRVLLGVL